LKSGEIYWVNLDPTIGDEIKKRRPVVVLSGGHNKNLKLAIVVPVTAWSSYWEKNPFFVSLEPDTKSGIKFFLQNRREMRSGKTTKKKGSKKKGSSLPLTLINFEHGVNRRLDPIRL